jgi:hypothetical protein
MDFVEAENEGVDWIHVAQGRDQWRTLVKTIVKYVFHKTVAVYGHSAPWNCLTFVTYAPDRIRIRSCEAKACTLMTSR